VNADNKAFLDTLDSDDEDVPKENNPKAKIFCKKKTRVGNRWVYSKTDIISLLSYNLSWSSSKVITFK